MPRIKPRLWDAATGDRLCTLEGHNDAVKSVALSADGSRVVTGSYDKTVRLWNTETKECLCTLKGHTSRVTSVALSADGSWVVSGSRDKTVRLWNAETGECLDTAPDTWFPTDASVPLAIPSHAVVLDMSQCDPKVPAGAAQLQKCQVGDNTVAARALKHTHIFTIKRSQRLAAARITS